MFHDLHQADLKLVDYRQGVSLDAGQGKQIADQVRVNSPDATPEPGDLGQRSGRLRQADGCEQLIESGSGQQPEVVESSSAISWASGTSVSTWRRFGSGSQSSADLCTARTGHYPGSPAGALAAGRTGGELDDLRVAEPGRWRPGARVFSRRVVSYSVAAAPGAGISRCTRRARLVIPSADWACMAALTCGPSSGKSRSRWNRVRPPSTAVSW